MSAPVVAHDVVRTPDGTLHTVIDAPTGGPVLVADWTGQHPHPLDSRYQVVYHHHARSPR